MALRGSKQSKAAQQQGWTAVTDQLIGSLASKLTVIIGIVLLLSCAYAVLLVTSRSCWSYGHSGAAYCKNAADCSQLNASAAFTNLDEDGSSALSGQLSQEPGSRSIISLENDHKRTSLDRIVFGIGASAHLWVNRSQFINLWWKQGYTRGYVWFDRDLGADWKPYDPPYKVSEDTTRFQYTHKTGHKAAIRISRIVSESFRLGLTDVDWFVMGDDDTFFFTDNLVRVLSKYDPKRLWYIGSNSEDHIQNQLFSYNMAYGGGGFAISYALAEVLAERQDECLERYPWLFGSDDRMKACMSELGVPLTKEPGFHQFDVRGDVRGLLAAHPMSPIISLHHLEAIYPLFPSMSRATAISHIMKAVNLSPHYIFQQSICYDDKKKWSFSVSWGYVVHVYKGFVPPNKLEVPTLTFLSWHRRRESFAFPLNTRPREREICEEPSSFYMNEADRTEEGGKLRTVYNNADRINRISVCRQKNLPLSLVKTVVVESEPVPPEWLMNPRRQCCRIADMQETSIKIDVGSCGEGESLVPDDIPERKARRRDDGNAARNRRHEGVAGKKDDVKPATKGGRNPENKDDGTAKKKADELAKSKEDDGRLSRKDDTVANRQDEAMSRRKDAGTAGKKDEGIANGVMAGIATKRDNKGTTAKRKDEGVVNRKSDEIVNRKTAE